MRKRILSLLLVFGMLTSLFPAQVWAENGRETAAAPTQASVQETQEPVSAQEQTSTQETAQTQQTQPKQAAPTFSDVKAGDWYYEAVRKAAELGLFSGSTADSFAPDGSMTRGMFVTVLAKMAGVQAGDYATPAAFGDVSADAYYAPYVAWALEHGITSGTGGGLFSPEATVDRQQMAVFLVRLFDTMGVEPDTKADTKTDTKTETKTDTKTEPKQESKPADLDQVDDWARDAVCKLWNLGVLRGDGVNFAPRKSATRAEAATMLTKTCEVVPEAAQALVKETPAEVPVEAPVEAPKPAGGGSGGGGGGVYYTLSFETNGGGTLSPRSVSAGSAMDGLPVPYIANKIFKGWYYDAELAKPVSAADRAEQSITLYAGYQDVGELEVAQTQTFVSATDVEGGFSIAIRSSLPSATAQDVLGGLTVKNLGATDIPTTELACVTREGDVFVLKAADGTFEAGASFKVTLEDDNLTYQEQPATVREYNFTTKKEEVLNMQLATGMKYIPLGEISNITKNGQSMESLSLALYSVGPDGGSASLAGTSSGTFCYTGTQTLQVGDKAAVYEGTRPDERTLETTGEDNGDLAYVKITAVNGSTYTYESAEAEEVIFTPDMLPIPLLADTDGDAENASITVPNSVLDFSHDDYANVGLDSQTTVDVGDFLYFYSGEFGAEGAEISHYARVESVSVDDDAAMTTIVYSAAEEKDAQTAMDIYATQQIEGKEMLEGVDVPELEEQIEVQAEESGFVEDASNYLASLALATDSFTQLSEEFELTDFSVQPISSDYDLERFSIDSISTDTALESFSLESADKADSGQGGAKKSPVVLVFPKEVSAHISTDVKHFKTSGLRLTLDVEVDIVILVTEDFQVTITVTGTFEQEIHLDIGVSSRAVWKVWFIFPYIADYRVSANIDLYDYTNVMVNATMVTQEVDKEGKLIKNDDYRYIAQEIKLLLERDEDGTGSMADTLAKKYKAMLDAEGDWVELVKQKIFEKEFHVPSVLPIIAVSVGVDFVVTANAVISVGFDFNFQNAKRYVYTISVFSGSVSNDVMDLSKETYELDVYVMGKLEIRAGINAHFAVGLISTKIASVGFSAEAGAYVKLYGFFCYQLKYTQDAGRSQRSIGAMLVEVGIYLDVNFEAQAFGDYTDRLSTKLALYEKEWPLWTAGNQRSIMDFTTAPANVPAVKLKQYVRNTFLPDSLFEMNYLDLVEGEDKTAIYDDQTRFLIEMTNSKFSYEPESNMVTVSPADDDLELKGQMIVTWLDYPLAFTSTPIQRKLDLSWDNLRDGYVIVPLTNGGSYIPILVQSYGSAVTPFANPTRAGYVFGGWYADENFETPYVFPKTMPNIDANIYAKWIPATDTPYRVEHYQQILGSSEYALFESDYFTGTTNTTVTPAVKTYEGFFSPVRGELVIAADGEAVLRYYYDRITYTVTFARGSVGGDDEVYELKYGGRITAPTFGAKGYIFEGWDKTVLPTMGAENQLYTARWTRIEAAYRVEYYVQQVNGSYILQTTEERKTPDETVTVASVRNDKAYVVPGGVAYRNTTVKGEAVDPVPIGGDGKTVVKVYYERLARTATFHPANGGADIVNTYLYGAKITAPDVTRAGYTFLGWEPLPGTMGFENTAHTAQWEANSGIAYKVEHYQQNANDDGYTLRETDALTGTTDTAVSASAKEYAHFHLNTNAAGAVPSGTVAADGSLVLKLYYDRDSFTLAYFDGEKKYKEAETYRHGQSVTTPTGLTKTGYNFGGWLLDGAAFNGTMPAENVSLYTKWLADDHFQYTVNYWQNGLKGAQAQSVRSDQVTGTFDAQTTVTPAHIYDGFTAPAAQTVTIGVGTVVDFYYTRNTYAVTWDYDGGTVTANAPDGEELEYQQTITPPTLAKTGYSYTWTPTVAATVGTQDLNYTAVWTPNRYTITFVSGGTSVNPVTQDYGTALTPPANPTRTGYVFDGWYADESLNTPYVFPETMPAGDATLYAKWSPATDTKYCVEHHQQILGGSEYSLFESENFTGTTNETVTPAAKSYEGFSAPAREELVITADGEAVLCYYYDRKTYTVTFKRGVVGGADEVHDVKYGGQITAPTFAAKGYIFEGWDKTVLSAMGAENQTYTAQWSRVQVDYSVEYYVQQLNGSYVLQTTDERKTPEATVTTASVRDDATYAVSGGLVYRNTTVKGEAVDPVPISGDGNTVAKVYYERVTHTATFHPANGGADFVHTYLYEANITAPSVTRAGYTFLGWEPAVFNTMGTENTAYTAQWEANSGISYKVEHYQQNANDDGYTLRETDALTGTTDAAVSASAKEYDYFHLNTNAAGAVPSGTVAADGSLVLKLYYDRDSFTLTCFNGEEQCGEPATYRYGQTVTTPTGLSKTGYNFGGWLLDGETFNEKMPARDASIYVKWLAKDQFQYTIKYWKNGLAGAQAQFVEPVKGAGTFDAQVTVTPTATYDGFTAPEAQTVTIGVGTVVDFYYTRNTYAVTWDYDGGTVTANAPDGEELEYQQTITPPTLAKTGYSYTWSPTVAATVGTEDLSYTAVWTPNRYTITFASADSTVNPITQDYGTALTPPADPTRTGYVFDGWYADESLNTPYVFPETMPAGDATLYAKWSPATDTKYCVEHHQQILGGSEYSLFESENLTGTTNETVTPATKSYEGFSAPARAELVITADGEAVLCYYYDRKTYTVTFKRGVVGGDDDVRDVKYGGQITAPTFAAKGYIFEGWDKTVLSTMGAENQTYTATWSRVQVDYSVEYYVQQLNESYVLQTTDERKTPEATVTTASVRDDATYAVSGGLVYRNTTVKGEAVDPVPISGDGNTVAKVYYERVTHTATFHPANGGTDLVHSYLYEANITAPSVTRAGYTFLGWEPAVFNTMGTENTAYTAQWEANSGISYKVEHYQQNANDDGYTLRETDALTGTTDATVSASAKEYDYFHLNSGAAGAVSSGTVAADGSLVLKLYYDRETFTLTYFDGEKQYGTAETYRYGQTVTTPTGLTKTGYSFNGWQPDGAEFDGTMPAQNVSLYATWLAKSYDYTVRYWKNGLKGAQAQEEEPVTGKGTFDAQITVTPTATYEGFTAPAAQTVTIGENTEVNFYYTRNTYTVTWDYDGGTVSGNTSGTEELEYQQSITPPTPVKAGYSCTWSPTVAATVGTQDLSYTAVWTPNRYTIKFVSDNSTVSSITQDYGTAVIPPADPTKTGYTFTGWDAELPATMPLDGATLTAQWSPVSYSIAYENLTGAVNHADNPAAYTVESGTLSLNAASKTGYTFENWYTDKALTNAVTSFTPDKGSLSAKTFYAKWKANEYSVTFNNSLKANLADTDTQVLVYDTAQALIPNAFTNTGYAFAGWTATQNGTVVEYADGATVKNLAPMGDLFFYAVWTPVTYGITYQGVDVGATGHGNPVSYTIETEDITLSAPTGRKTGYQFLGWYDENGKQVTAVTKGSHGAVSLTAKWAHGGFFSVAYTSSSEGTSTFTITRTLPTQTSATTDPQNVYYRTLNGTAIGGTAEAIHFAHVGASDVSAEFVSTQMSQTFTVKGENINAVYTQDGSKEYAGTAFTGNSAPATQNDQTRTRYYDVELYKVLSTQGNCTGFVNADQSRARRTMTIDDAHYLTKATFYETWRNAYLTDTTTQYTVTDDTNYGGNTYSVVPLDLWGGEYAVYLKHTTVDLLWRVVLDTYEWNDGNQFICFYTDTGRQDDWGFQVPGEGDERWYNDCIVPYSTENHGIYDISHGWRSDDTGASKQDLSFNSTYNGIYIPISVDRTDRISKVDIRFAAGGKGDDDWRYRALRHEARALDVSQPKQIGLAPMAFGELKQGDTVTLSLVFDELIDSVSSLTAQDLTVNGLPLTGLKYVDGTGTNVLTFTATVGALAGGSLTINPGFNDEVIFQQLTLSGSVTDLSGNVTTFGN